MHTPEALRTAVEAVALPHSGLTIGSSRALQSFSQTEHGLHIDLCFGFPVDHIARRFHKNSFPN